MEKKELITLAKSNKESCDIIAKNLGWLSRRLKKTSPEDEDKFQANLIEAAFMLNSYAMATKAFEKMVTEKNENPELEKHMFEYFKEEIEIVLKQMEKQDDN